MNDTLAYENFYEMSKDELIGFVEELLRECDERHAHEDALEEQVRLLGQVPISFSETSPLPGKPDNFSCEN